MKYVIIGKGKLGGQVIRCLPQENILAICDQSNPPTVDLLKKAQTTLVCVPDHQFEAILPILIESQTPAIIATTGYEWSEKLQSLVYTKNLRWIVGSNFSLGMNLAFFFAQELGQLMRSMPEAFSGSQLSIHEIHHVHKKDSPSGTALSLKKACDMREIPITADREGEVIGIHHLKLQLPHELLTISHEAQDRGIFAKGAIWAAQTLLPKVNPGLHFFEKLLQDHFQESLNQ
ncbi:hypothetical protein AYO37_00420 [Opitutia bacterium SCGC AG-212-L18]|nr:hypothetical protein AYO37_00420 [Opitutae bacterium SCGC AG-212-L18]